MWGVAGSAPAQQPRSTLAALAAPLERFDAPYEPTKGKRGQKAWFEGPEHSAQQVA